ncbi:MAG: hypothetical protein SOV55_02435 [Candidatus Borkfalkiaceae bacterium]|nr:hypothetical protein [Christensenellaceae bacterium]
MNNLLPLLLFFLSAAKNGNSGENDLIKNLLSSFSSSLGKENGELFSSLLSGNFNAEKMLPLLIKSLSSGGDNSPLSWLFQNANTPGNSDYRDFSGKSNGSLHSENASDGASDKSICDDSADEKRDENEFCRPNYLNPITDIADERINFALSHYFSND